MEAVLEAGGTCVAVLANGPGADAYPHANAEVLQRGVDALNQMLEDDVEDESVAER